MKELNSVIKFSEMYKADEFMEIFRDYQNHFFAQNWPKGASDPKFDYRKDMSFDKKEGIMREALKDQIEKMTNVKYNDLQLVDYISNPQVKWAFFAIVRQMVDAVLPDSLVRSVGAYASIHMDGFGNSFSFDIEPRDLFPVSRAGSFKKQGEVHRQYRGQVNVLPINHQITVGVALYRVLAGEESLAKFVAKALRSIESEMLLEAYNLLSTSLDANLATTGDKQLQLTSWDADEAIKIAQKVEAWNGGAKPVFLGTNAAISKILPDDANYRYDLESEYVKVGYVRVFRGYDVIELPQVADWSTEFKTALDDTEIYIISPSAEKLIRICLEGDTLSYVDDLNANADLMQNATFHKKWGIGVTYSAIAGLIDIAK